MYHCYAKITGKRKTPAKRALLLFVLALSSCLGLLFAFDRRLFVVFSLAEFHEDPRFLTRTLETTESTVDRLVFFHSDFCHDIPSLRSNRELVL